MPGFFASSLLMDAYGRRRAHALAVLPGCLGWTMIYYAHNIPLLIIGRILGGFTAGATVSLGAIAIGEYTSPKYRGMFLNLKTTAVCLGSMMVHVLANFCHWRTVALIAVLPHILALAIIYTWKESPSWLAGRQEFEKCEEGFYWLRGKSDSSRRELDELIDAQMHKSIAESKDEGFLKRCVLLFKKFTQKDFVKPVIIIFFGAILLETSGRHLFPAYALQIIGEITGSGSKVHSFYYTLAIDLIITCSTLFSSILVRLAKRRTLLFSTGFAAFIVVMSVCCYLFLASRNVISQENNWIPICMFVVYFILVNVGCTPIPLALLGEVFPLAHRGAGSAVAGLVMSVCVSLGLHLTPLMLAAVHVSGTFAAYGLVMAACLLALYCLLPETKDRTLQEIEDYFNYGYFKETKRDLDSDPDREVKEKMVQ